MIAQQKPGLLKAAESLEGEFLQLVDLARLVARLYVEAAEVWPSERRQAGLRDVLDPARLARINNGMRFVPVANALADQVERAAKAWDEFDTLFCLAANREGGDAA